MREENETSDSANC